MYGAAGREDGGADLPTVSAEERDALCSQAMDLLSGIGARQARLDPRFLGDLRALLGALGEIGDGGPSPLTMPPADLRRVLSGIRSRLPEESTGTWRSARTRLVSGACDRILAPSGQEAGRGVEGRS
jgi:hypothetical protein